MTDNNLPLLMEPTQLESLLDDESVLVVDLSKSSVHRQAHIPGAVFLEYGDIVAAKPPVAGLLPTPEVIENVLSSIGIDSNTHVIAYDDEGGGKAARLLWTLECMGHQRFSLLNGGLHAWLNEKHPLTNEPTPPKPSVFSATLTEHPIASTEYILSKLDSENTALLDARSPEEYSGARRYSQFGGHIPGAINLDWTAGMDQSRNLRMRDSQELLALLGKLNITPEKEVICYCQTHHRSSYSYIMLKVLGFEMVRGYHGSWSDWGNRSDTPIIQSVNPL